MTVEVLSAVALLTGATLMALGGLGLLRFPDVFTRMHAATKAATVGVIAMTAAAAAEAGTAGGVMVLILVVALLFLTAPLGMSLLARAAYHDPETFRAPATREISTRIPEHDPGAPRRSAGTSPTLAAWLFVIWVAVFGSLAANVLVGGAIVATITAFALRRLAPRWPHALLHPIAAIRFVGYFVTRLAAGTAAVAWALRLDPARIRPAILIVPLRVETRNEVTLLMNSISFIPGTVALELHGGEIYVHVLTVDDPQQVIAEIAELEERIAAAFSRAPLDRNGNHVSEDV